MRENRKIVSRRLIISGRVQGVSYRAWCVEEARKLGLDGWVRNRRDGTVELLMTGAPDAVGAMTARCREGPLFARVDGIECKDSDEPVPAGFEQRPSV